MISREFEHTVNIEKKEKNGKCARERKTNKHIHIQLKRKKSLNRSVDMSSEWQVMRLMQMMNSREA
jgi:hypothetical protein